jgi:hypothetical protein
LLALAVVACLTLAVGVAVLEMRPPELVVGESVWVALGSDEAVRLLLTWVAMVAAVLLPGLLSRPVSGGTRPTAGGLPLG